MSDGRMTRRQVFTELPRLALAGAMTAGVAALASRPQGPPTENKCVGNRVCRGCRVLSRCNRPRALSAKAAGVRA